MNLERGEVWSDTGHCLILLRVDIKTARESVLYSRYGEKRRSEPRPGSTYGCQYIDPEQIRYVEITTITVK